MCVIPKQLKIIGQKNVFQCDSISEMWAVINDELSKWVGLPGWETEKKIVKS